MSNAQIKAFSELCKRKASKGSEPIVMVTAYDRPSATFALEGNCDLILVGDSAAMVFLGYESTMMIKHEEMVILVSAVSRSQNQLPIIADMVWGSYHVSKKRAVENAIELIQSGANAVKIEGGKERVKTIKALVKAQIPVVSHIGLTPQSILELGSYSVQGKDIDSAKAILDDAKAVEEAGACMLVVECVPDGLSRVIAEELSIPVIGIGAGRHVDGQVLVMHDLLGITKELPKFVRKFADLSSSAIEGVSSYAKAVRGASFPSSEETYHISEEVITEMRNETAGFRPTSAK